MWSSLILLAALPSAGAWAVAGRASPHAGCCTQRRAGPAMCAADGAYGEGMTQTDMMEKDMLILVDGADRVSGSMSKRAAHTFDAENPRGRLHRAFSCFLFDSVSVSPSSGSGSPLEHGRRSRTATACLAGGTDAPDPARRLQDHVPQRLDERLLLTPTARPRAK